VSGDNLSPNDRVLQAPRRRARSGFAPADARRPNATFVTAFYLFRGSLPFISEPRATRGASFGSQSELKTKDPLWDYQITVNLKEKSQDQPKDPQIS